MGDNIKQCKCQSQAEIPFSDRSRIILKLLYPHVGKATLQMPWLLVLQVAEKVKKTTRLHSTYVSPLPEIIRVNKELFFITEKKRDL